MRAWFTICLLGCAIALVAWSQSGASAAAKDDAASLAAFATMTKVMTHPRCMNCHTTAQWPTQGDDQHRHTFSVMRGPQNRGASGMSCANCHKDKNVANIPGAKDWHMAALSQGWTGLNPAAMCKALLDPAKNGGLTGEKVIEHLKDAPLVLWAWNPGGKRTPPPITHAEFLAAAKTWIAKGARCPAG